MRDEMASSLIPHPSSLLEASVGTGQIVFGILIIIVTAAVGGYYVFRQWQTLRRLRGDRLLPDEERIFQRNQAWRRLAGAVLLLLIAGLFVGVFYFEGTASQLVQQGEEARKNNEHLHPDSTQLDFLRLYDSYVIVLLLLLLGLIAIAGYEMFAIRRYSVRHLRRIQDERRAMIARETARLRQERNGHA